MTSKPTKDRLIASDEYPERKRKKLVPVVCRQCQKQFGTDIGERGETKREILCPKCEFGTFEAFMAQRKITTCEKCFGLFYANTSRADYEICSECKQKQTEQDGYVWDNYHEYNARLRRNTRYWLGEDE